MSLEILSNLDGVPMIAYGKKAFIDTIGAPARKTIARPEPEDEADQRSFEVFDYTISPWGEDNDFPEEALDIIGRTGVLNIGLKFLMKVILGQGIFPVRVTGYDTDGNEILEVVDDPKINKLLRSRMIRRYMENSLRDLLKLGRPFPQMILNEKGDQIVGINPVNARFCRLTEMENGIIKHCIVSGQWPDTPSEKTKYSAIAMLDNYDPGADLRAKRIKNEKERSYIYPLCDDWSNDEYYPLPDWWTSKRAGWTDIAKQVPNFLLNAYKNQITWMWHVQIPYAYWDKKYPANEYKTPKARLEAIQLEMNKIEDRLTDTENANKALFTMFEVNPSGKPEEAWIITPLDNKYKADNNLITSAAANSEILFALMINPNVLGAGMPGGTYSGNQGGSNIREAFLVNIANAWLERQKILDPIELMLEFNGHKDIELRFRNTILTTLDTGAGTSKTLS